MVPQQAPITLIPFSLFQSTLFLSKNQDLVVFQKAKSLLNYLESHKVGAVTEKAHFWDPTKWQDFREGIWSMPTYLIWWDKQIFLGRGSLTNNQVLCW